MALSKRTLAIVLTLALLLASSSVAAFADDSMTAEDKAGVLHELDLFLGVDPEVFTPNLEGATDRAAAMVMVARALGWVSAEDWDENAVSGFTDVPDWAEPHVACAVDKGVTVGVGGDLFGNDLPVTQRQLQTWFDRALGKGDTWEDNEELDNVTPLIRADLVAGTWEALMEVPVDGEKTLIENIIGDDEEMLIIAVRGGLIATAEIGDPDDYDVVVQDVEKLDYLPGDSLEFTICGLEPFTPVQVYVRVHTGGPGFPFFDGDVLVEGDPTGLVANADGCVTIQGELAPDLPTGALVFTLPDYGYFIDNTLSLMKDGAHAQLVEEVTE